MTHEITMTRDHLQDDVLGQPVIVASLLVIASLPVVSAGLIERVYCSERQIHLMAVEANYFS